LNFHAINISILVIYNTFNHDNKIGNLEKDNHKMLYIQKKLNIIILLLSLGLFFFLLSSVITYGLPFFLNGDEATFIKSTLYFYGFFTHAHQNLIDPIITPLLNFLLSGFIGLIYKIFLTNFSLSEFQDFIFLNPDKFILFSRISSLLVSSGSVILSYLILKKLKIESSIFFLFVLSISLSPIFIDVAIVGGKNAYLLFFYLIQIYFFLKYFNNPEKFTFKVYILFAILGSIAWGINFWGSLPSIYSILFLHYQKYKFKEINRIIFFGLLFFLIGVFPNYILSAGHNPFQHLFDSSLIDNDNIMYPVKNRFYIFSQEIYQSIYFIFITEKFISIIIIFLMVYLVKEKKNIKDSDFKIKIVLTFIFFIFEPVLLFAIAEWSYPQFRYFGPSIFILNFLFIYLSHIYFTNLKNYKYKIFFVSFFMIIFFSSLYTKINIHYKFKETINKKFIQYQIFDKFSEKNVIYSLSHLMMRENSETLKLYRKLLEQKIILPGIAGDGRNSPEQIEKKISILQKYEKKNIRQNSKNLIFLGQEFDINKEKKLVNFLKNNFDAIILEKDNVILNNILTNENIERNILSESMKIYTARTLLIRILDNSKDDYIVGPEIYIYNFN